MSSCMFSDIESRVQKTESRVTFIFLEKSRVSKQKSRVTKRTEKRLMLGVGLTIFCWLPELSS